MVCVRRRGFIVNAPRWLTHCAAPRTTYSIGCASTLSRYTGMLELARLVEAADSAILRLLRAEPSGAERRAAATLAPNELQESDFAHGVEQQASKCGATREVGGCDSELTVLAARYSAHWSLVTPSWGLMH
jgi:TRAP-type uncharacterized transport system substrate-binding protein